MPEYVQEFMDKLYLEYGADYMNALQLALNLDDEDFADYCFSSESPF